MLIDAEVVLLADQVAKLITRQDDGFAVLRLAHRQVIPVRSVPAVRLTAEKIFGFTCKIEQLLIRVQYDILSISKPLTS